MLLCSIHSLAIKECPTKVDWRDTNMANVGSDIDKMIRKFVAEGEPAWEGVGRKPEMKIWRIEQFKVVAWDSSRYGEFYNGETHSPSSHTAPHTHSQ